MKHIKLFESFVNEELSPELQKRTYDAMMKIAKDPNAIDYLVRRQQADNVQKTLSPEVEKLRKELEEHGKRILKTKVYVNLDDDGLESGIVNLFVEDAVRNINRRVSGKGLFGLTISKDRYESIYAGQNQNGICQDFLRDRPFINTLKRLIVQIQKDEIPGEEVVPSEPESVTPEGSLDYLVRRQQVDNVWETLSPEVEKLRKELEEHGKRILKKRVYVNLDDDGLESGIVNLFVDDVVGKIKRMGGGEGLFGLTISKNKYESIYAGQNQNVTFLRDRPFINTLKRLIVQIQKDEIPGEEVVTSEPESVTPEGSIDHNM